MIPTATKEHFPGGHVWVGHQKDMTAEIASILAAAAGH